MSDPRRYPDQRIMAEWAIRRERYIAVTRKLRLSFYSLLIAAVLLVFFAEGQFRIYGAALFMVSFIAHFSFLWAASIRILRCPNCGAIPIAWGRGFGMLLHASVCNHCLCYLHVEP